jgi:hypothetical protein
MSLLMSVLQIENAGVPVNKPVVVFVKDQMLHDFERFSPGSNSNTDSGRGNSDYGEEPSPPLTTSHEPQSTILPIVLLNNTNTTLAKSAPN